MGKLSESEIRTQLESLKGWDRLGDMIVKRWQFSTPARALEFVGKVTELAQRMDHYPELWLWFRDVRVELTTHAEGGVTILDVEAAGKIDQLAPER